MRRFPIWLFASLMSLLVSLTSVPVRAQDPYYSATYQDFYDGLSPYGQWIYDAQYGYVWLPDAGPDFRPYYTNGYWAMTEYGNTWVSGYDWGWAPFHYGRWTYDNYYGWLWIPDTEWAPAWVSWRSNNDYYGWAPMGPGININVNLGLIPVDWWIFLSPNYFYDRSFYRYCNHDYRFRRNTYSRTTIINYTYVDNRTTYYTGPRGNDYYRHTGRRPSMFDISNNRRAGATRISGNRINMYRPSMRNTANAAPSRAQRADRPVSARPQAFSGNAGNAPGREMILRQRNNTETARPDNNTKGRINQPDNNNTRNGMSGQRDNIRPGEQQNLQQQRDQQVQQQRAVQMQQQRVQQQRDQQVQQQRVQQQRDQQVQQQRMQQQRDQQVQQQREAQMQQQRAQQQREQQVQQRMQQQRDQQVQQQKEAQMQQQRDQRVQQQRETQMQQQRMQQQRDQQVQQQRMQHQRDQQAPQQRMQQMQQPQNNPAQGKPMRSR